MNKHRTNRTEKNSAVHTSYKATVQCAEISSLI